LHPQHDPALPTVDRELILDGERWFRELGCAQCHDVASKSKSTLASSKPLSNLDHDAARSCLNPADMTTPRFNLDSAQSSTIRSALVKRKSGRTLAETDEQFISRTLLQHNCLFCHERNGSGGIGRSQRPYFDTVNHVDLGDEGRLPPPLTGVGNKLKTSWLELVFKGDARTRLRPHMTVRMPLFPGLLAKPLASRIVHAVQVPNSKFESASSNRFAQLISKSSDHESKIGRELMDVGCIQCHAFGGETLPGVVGVDISSIQDRVQPEWFLRFLTNPVSLKARTRMPTFFPDGKSQRPDLLEGDPTHQISAMWTYLNRVDKLGVPVKIEEALAQDFELKPTDTPVVLRTFMHGIGERAIAVGFPAGRHFAFDADACQLAIVWKGRFIDARSTWFERFSPSINPLGKDLIQLLPTNHSPALTPRYRGYRLDQSRTPSFTYDVGDWRVEDRIAPNATNTGLHRRLTITPIPNLPHAPTTQMFQLETLDNGEVSQRTYEIREPRRIEWEYSW
jgi:mono/diheme cytochrome c family protein